MSTATLRASSERQGLLRRALIADGLLSGSFGLLLAVAAGPLADPLELPVLLLRLAGLSLLPFAGALFYLAPRIERHRRLVWDVVAVNLAWVAASILLLVSGWVDPTSLGVVFVSGQALAVAGFAALQIFGLRRAA